MLYFSVSCILLAVFFIFSYKKRFRFPFFTLLVLLLGVLLTVIYGVSDHFTNRGIDESVIYHLRYGLGEAGFAEYAGVIVAAAIALTAIVAFFYYFLRIVLPRNSKGSEQGKLRYTPLLLSILAVGVNPATENIYSLLQASIIQHPVDHADYVTVNEISDKPLLNLIYIYAESLEETYFDETLFPGLMPNLNKVRDKAIVFKDVAQVTHTGWTIAGMVASQCGVPLFSASQGNAMSGMPQFLSGARCLGDVLSRNHYQLSYLGGASLQFAGKGHFYETHGFSSIQGREQLSEQLDDKSYQSAWGLYDDSLFDIAKRKLATESAHNNPFALFMLTLDTHHPRGHLSARCVNHKYADGSNEILNAVHCSDALITEFIEYIKDNGFADNTLIVIGSDHLAMRNTATHLLEQGNRKNMLFMIPPDLDEGRVIDRPSSILDVSATVLPLLGFKAEALGFGRNILSENIAQLIEEHDNFNAYLNSANALVASFWEYPDALNDVYFDEEKKQAYFGEHTISYPALFLINESNATERVIFEFDSEKSLSEYLQAETQGQKLLWVDQCFKLDAVFETGRKVDEQQHCVAIGRLGSEKLWVEQLKQKSKLTKKEIAEQLVKHRTAVNSDSYLKQTKVLKVIAATGVNAEVFTVLPKGSSFQSVFIKSVAGLNGESFVSYKNQSDEVKLQGFNRGLNLVGFTQGGQAQMIYQLDTCQAETKNTDNQNLIAVLNQHKHDFYLLVGHDSTVCGSDESLRRFMSGSSLELWPELAWRQAYTAIIYQDGRSLELLGENGQAVNVILE